MARIHGRRHLCYDKFDGTESIRISAEGFTPLECRLKVVYK